MKPLNFFEKADVAIKTRQIKPFRHYGAENTIRTQLYFARNAPKFVLPNSGNIFETEFRGLIGTYLRMPFPVTVLEFPLSYDVNDKGSVKGGAILIVKDTADYIEIFSMYYVPNTPMFVNYGDWNINPLVGRIYRNRKTAVNSIKKTEFEENLAEVFKAVDKKPISIDAIEDLEIETIYPSTEFEINQAQISMSYDAGVVLSFIEALSCSNIKISNLAKNQKRKGNKLLPSKDIYQYKVLTIETKESPTSVKSAEVSIEERHSPREHLRRGHIRTQHYKDGLKKIWINSTVVNAGKGGKVDKEYLVA